MYGMLYLPTRMVDVYGINVGKYTSPIEYLGKIKHVFFPDSAVLANLSTLGDYRLQWAIVKI